MSLQPSEGGFGVLKLLLAGLAIGAALDLGACHRPSHQAAGTAARQRPAPPPFTAQDRAAALDALSHAADQGVPAQRFHLDQIQRLLASAAPSDRVQGEQRLRAAVLDYARAQHGLAIPEGALPSPWKQRPPFDAEAELDAALRSGTLRAWLGALPPQSPEYRALQAAYVEAQKTGAGRSGPWVQPGPLEIGQQDAGTAVLRQRLAMEDRGLADTDPGTPADQALIDALKVYQAHHDLKPTGALDQATADRLNARVMSPADKLRVNMERLRWLPRPEPATRIDVNIAAAQTAYYKDGQLSTQMLAVAGKPGDETPMLSSAIDSMVLNPAWHVPNKIARREILPKGPGYMESHNFVWRNGRLVQLPGPKTALGLVKFDFPNPYAVYLHDTPAKAGFAQTQRTESHGCVRLQHAVDLAKTIAEDQPGLSADRIDDTLASGRTVRVRLARPIPVRLMYLTAEPNGGAIVYPPDVYGWDAELLALLDRYEGPLENARAASPSADGPGPGAPAPSADQPG